MSEVPCTLHHVSNPVASGPPTETIEEKKETHHGTH